MPLEPNLTTGSGISSGTIGEAPAKNHYAEKHCGTWVRARWLYAEKRRHSSATRLFLGSILSVDLLGSQQSSRLLLFIQIGSRYHSLSRITCEHNEPLSSCGHFEYRVTN